MLSMIGDIPFIDIGKGVEDQMLGKRVFRYKQVDELGFYEEILAFWKEHQFSESQASLTIYHTGNGSLDKQIFFEKIKDNNLCGTIQSKAFKCGNREDVRLERVELPQVIRIVYVNDTVHIASNLDRLTSNRSVYLTNVYFGGFEGNGIITKSVNIPGNAIQIKLRLITGADFDLTINGNTCDLTFLTTDEIDTWDLSECADLIVPGDNLFEFTFKTPDLFRKYVAGGFMTIVHEEEPVSGDFQLPMIDGTINYFNSFESDGSTPVRINLDYNVGDLAGTDIYVSVGDSIIYQDAVSSHDYSGIITVPTSALVNGMNPIRIGVNSEQSTEKTIDVPVPVDVVLITDQSGSMAWNLSVPYGLRLPDGEERGCLDPLLYDMSTMKMSLAKCFGEEFVNIVLDKYRSNRIGLVAFEERVRSWLNVTSDRDELHAELDNYEPDGGTCVSCAIFRAREILQGSDRVKAMVIMTDGVANACLEGECDREEAQREAREQGQLAYDEGISLYTIAFGDGADSTILQDIACFDNCSHFGQGTNSTEIQKIYQDFANSIAQQHAIKTKHVQGAKDENEVASILRDSDISVPVDAISRHKTLVRKDLACPGLFDLPEGMTIDNAQLLSWAGTLWMQSVELNNVFIYDVSGYTSIYLFVGDPFMIELPTDTLAVHNSINPTFSDVEKETIICGPTTIQYVVDIPDNGFTHAMGCHWTVQYPEETVEFTSPVDYIGDRYCEYTTENIKYTSEDVFQYAVGSVLDGLDFNDDGRVDDKLDEIYVIGGFT